MKVTRARLNLSVVEWGMWGVMANIVHLVTSRKTTEKWKVGKIPLGMATLTVTILATTKVRCSLKIPASMRGSRWVVSLPITRKCLKRQ